MDGFSLYAAGHLDAAEHWFRCALVHRPDDGKLAYALGMVLLAQGRYAEGIDAYDQRHAFGTAPLPKVPWPEWRGEPVRGKHIVIFPEQGLGDQIQFARFAPILRDAGADVTLLCNLLLTRLFGSLGVRVASATGTVDFPEPDFWVRSNSLLRLAPTLADVPGAPYLTGSGPLRPGRFGVMTHGNPHHPFDNLRSPPPEVREKLLAMPGAVSLHPEDTGARDLQETADIIAGLDFVVTVDTAVAHLAGAMGKDVRILLPTPATDWRWGQSGRTNWYPTATLCRQARPGDWSISLSP